MLIDGNHLLLATVEVYTKTLFSNKQCSILTKRVYQLLPFLEESAFLNWNCRRKSDVSVSFLKTTKTDFTIIWRSPRRNLCPDCVAISFSDYTFTWSPVEEFIPSEEVVKWERCTRRNSRELKCSSRTKLKLVFNESHDLLFLISFSFFRRVWKTILNVLVS